VLLEEDDNITIEDIKGMRKWNDKTQQDLKELDEIVQEFSRRKCYTENREQNYHSK
jgi:hypothetical protein